MNGCTPSVTAISEKPPKPGSWSQVQGMFKAQDTVFVAKGRSVFLSLGVIWRAEGGRRRAGPRICLQGLERVSWACDSELAVLSQAAGVGLPFYRGSERVCMGPEVAQQISR